MAATTACGRPATTPGLATSPVKSYSRPPVAPRSRSRLVRWRWYTASRDCWPATGRVGGGRTGARQPAAHDPLDARPRRVDPGVLRAGGAGAGSVGPPSPDSRPTRLRLPLAVGASLALAAATKLSGGIAAVGFALFGAFQQGLALVRSRHTVQLRSWVDVGVAAVVVFIVVNPLLYPAPVPRTIA